MNTLNRRQAKRHTQYGTLILLLASLPAIGGCGQGTYDARAKERLASLNYATPFLKYIHQDETIVPETGVKFRLPTIFGKSTNIWLWGNTDKKGKPVKPIRILPPAIPLPGFLYCYEQFSRFPSARHDMPIYCYVAVLDGREQTQRDIMDSALQAAKAAFQDSDLEWREVNVPRPGGQSLPARLLSVTGEQRFDCVPPGAKDEPFEGRYDLYLISSRTKHVLIGWRAPLLVSGKFDFFAATEATIGTLVIEAPSPGLSGPPAYPAPGLLEEKPPQVASLPETPKAPTTTTPPANNPPPDTINPLNTPTIPDKPAELGDRAAQQLTALKEVRSVAFSPSGRSLATGGESGIVTIWHADSGERRMLLEGHTAAVTHVAYSPDSSLLVSSTFDANLSKRTEMRVWDLLTQKMTREQTLDGKTIATAPTFSRDNRYIVASLDREITVMDVAVGLTRKRKFEDGQLQAVCCARFNNQLILAVKRLSGRIELRFADMQGDEETKFFRHLPETVDQIYECEDGNQWAIAMGRRLIAWSRNEQDPVSFSCPIPEGFHKFGLLVLSPKGEYAAVQPFHRSGSRGPIQIWETGAQKLTSIEGTEGALDVDFGVGTLAVVHKDGRVRLYDSGSLKERD